MDSYKRLKHIHENLLKTFVKSKSSNTSTLITEYDTPKHLEKFNFPNLTYESNFKNKLSEAQEIGLLTSSESKTRFEMIVLSLQKSRMEALMQVASAYHQTKNNGLIFIEGSKRVGIDSTIKSLSKLIDLEFVTPKAHGKIAVIKVISNKVDKFNEWIELLEPQRNSAGFFTIPGLFSYKNVDPASQFLASKFNEKIYGDVVDLGAGWGFLSSEALKKSLLIDTITLVDNDLRAIKTAKLNVKNSKAIFNWMHFSETTNSDKKYDAAICNPPFHIGRETDISLGKSFINTISKILKKNGQLWLVANIHLPYENVIDDLFHKHETIGKNKFFKIILAGNPK